MIATIFSWDERKNDQNRRKHGISFEEARTVFYDERARILDDDENSDLEERFVLLGFSLGVRLLVVCHCYRKEDNEIRLISARKATKREIKQYERWAK